jgi:hypothetical protein
MLPDTVPTAVPSTAQRNNGSVSVPLFTPNNGTSSGTETNGSAIRTGVIAPGGSVSGSGIAQGNVGPTQSGPGAAGLFTPNSPGNAAAYNAQLTGGLVGSPIVDGNGANIRVTVPMSTPSVVPAYQQYTNGAVTGPISGIVTGASRPATTGAPSKPSRSTQNSSVRTNRVMVRSVSYLKAPLAVSMKHSLNPNKFYSNQRTLTLDQRATTDVMKMLGDVTGTITYADGQKVLFGTEGSLTFGSKQLGALSLSNGKIIPIENADELFRQVAQRTQMHL